MKQDEVFLRHVLESIEKIELFTEGIERTEFMELEEKQEAVIRKVEVIGEAVKNISGAFRKQHPAVPWSEIAKTRDKLIHGYFEVNLERVWTVVKRDLPQLKRQTKKMLEEEHCN